ncbi:MAG: N-6 DNA methylase [Armatimonadota bacterium]
MSYDPRKSLVKRIEAVGRRYGTWEAFRDFCEMGAIAISNAVDLSQRETREARYLEIVKQYDREAIDEFPKMLVDLGDALTPWPTDVLGGVFHELELHSKWHGQYFTPNEIAHMMGKMTVGHTDGELLQQPFFTACEPASGSGAMILGLARALYDEGINYQQRLHVTAVDIDIRCVHMCYLQLALLHIPAVVIHGNSLSMEERSHWFTPAHILDGWTYRLRHRQERAWEPAAGAEPSHPPAAVVMEETVVHEPREARQLVLF